MIFLSSCLPIQTNILPGRTSSACSQHVLTHGRCLARRKHCTRHVERVSSLLGSQGVSVTDIPNVGFSDAALRRLQFRLVHSTPSLLQTTVRGPDVCWLVLAVCQSSSLLHLASVTGGPKTALRLAGSLERLTGLRVVVTVIL